MKGLKLLIEVLYLMNESIRVLIADDTLPARQGLDALLSMIPRVEVIGQAANGQEAVQLVNMLRPDVVLMDIQMPVMDGLEATRQIKSSWSETKVIVLAMYSSYQSEAYAVGVDMFLRKGCPSKSLQYAILNDLAE